MHITKLTNYLETIAGNASVSFSDECSELMSCFHSLVWTLYFYFIFLPTEVFSSCLAIVWAVTVGGLFLWPALWYGTGYQTVWETRPSAETPSDVHWRRFYFQLTCVHSALEVSGRCALQIYLLTYLLTFKIFVLLSIAQFVHVSTQCGRKTTRITCRWVGRNAQRNFSRLWAEVHQI